MTCLLALIVLYDAGAQNKVGKIDDIGRMALSPFIAENSNIPPYSANLMTTKMRTAITRSGLGSSAYDPRFVLTVNADVLSQNTTPTTPPMVATVISVSFHIGDLRDGTLFASFTLPNKIKGVGKNEDRAYMQALKNVNLNQAEFMQFIEEGKTKIIEFYNTNIRFILTEAEALANKEDYDGAIALLMGVPTICADAYEQALELTQTIYQRKIDLESAQMLEKARIAWAGAQNETGAETAGEYLASVHPSSGSAQAAKELYTEIKSHFKEIADREKEIVDREWEFQKQQYQDAVELQKEAVQAAKEIAVAKASQPITYNVKQVAWW